MTFEEQMKRLSEITKTLEHGELTLEESVSLYQEGLQVAEQCRSELDTAKQSLKKESNSVQQREESNT